ncbi:hypothetical protein Y032_0043g822 [Ancylostoma ceylanicum]|uniref:Uncharacterized protein n=1 Tax=Ancylostoma ceylanicum TaxID=53326 RepID=A0A016UFJ9_9BILA|nr:hypothetical protein Y032_0043g822 [Ancylostoma ceylanicum]
MTKIVTKTVSSYEDKIAPKTPNRHPVPIFEAFLMIHGPMRKERFVYDGYPVCKRCRDARYDKNENPCDSSDYATRQALK